MGVLAGSVTLTGGPATGLAFAPLFEEAGVPGAATLAVAAAMVGIVAGGVMGGPIGTYLVERQRARRDARTPRRAAPSRTRRSADADTGASRHRRTRTSKSYVLMKHLVVLIVTVGLGIWVSRWLTDAGMTLPAYIGAMLVAAVVPQPRRSHRRCSACRSASSTTSATSRCRCSW